MASFMGETTISEPHDWLGEEKQRVVQRSAALHPTLLGNHREQRRMVDRWLVHLGALPPSPPLILPLSLSLAASEGWSNNCADSGIPIEMVRCGNGALRRNLHAKKMSSQLNVKFGKSKRCDFARSLQEMLTFVSSTRLS